jgi:hypothetical protein
MSQTEIDCTDLVLHVQPSSGETITDKVSGNEASVEGSVTVDSTATLFGGDTINAAGNLIFEDISTDFMLGTQEVTMEAWFQPKSSSTYNQVFSFRHPSRNRTNIDLVYRGDVTSVLSGNGGPNKWFQFLVNEGSGSTSNSNIYRVWNAFVSPVEIQAGTWHHLALVRQSTTWDLYINGQLSTLHTGSWVGGGNFNTTTEVQLEYEADVSLFGLNGVYGDMFGQDFRISKKAVYTSNFTPPASLLPLCTLSEPSQPSCDQVALHLQPATGETILDRSGNNHEITVVGDIQTTLVGSLPTPPSSTIYFGHSIDRSGDTLAIGARDSNAVHIYDILSDGSYSFNQTILGSYGHGCAFYNNELYLTDYNSKIVAYVKQGDGTWVYSRDIALPPPGYENGFAIRRIYI